MNLVGIENLQGDFNLMGDFERGLFLRTEGLDELLLLLELDELDDELDDNDRRFLLRLQWICLYYF